MPPTMTEVQGGTVQAERVENVAWVYRGGVFQARITDKAKERLIEGKIKAEDLVVRCLRLQKFDVLPDIDILGNAYKEDARDITDAVRQAVSHNARKL